LLKKEEEGIRLQIYRFFGGWVWSEGKKKKQARADCVRPSRAPTSIYMCHVVFFVYFWLLVVETWFLPCKSPFTYKFN
jgi:hypothetical protein